MALVEEPESREHVKDSDVAKLVEEKKAASDKKAGGGGGLGGFAGGGGGGAKPAAAPAGAKPAAATTGAAKVRRLLPFSGIFLGAAEPVTHRLNRFKRASSSHARLFISVVNAPAVFLCPSGCGPCCGCACHAVRA